MHRNLDSRTSVLVDLREGETHPRSEPSDRIWKHRSRWAFSLTHTHKGRNRKGGVRTRAEREKGTLDGQIQTTGVGPSGSFRPESFLIRVPV